MNKVYEKEYGKTEQSRLNAIFKMRELKRAGFIAHVVYGNDMQFIVEWHAKPVKKYKARKNLTGAEKPPLSVSRAWAVKKGGT